MEDLDQIYQEHAQMIYHFLLAQTHNPSLAEELTQETFYQAVRSIDRFDGKSKLSTWLCQIAKHLWYQYRQKHRREVPLEQDLAEALPSAEDHVLEQEDRLQLLRSVHALPDPIREVVYLRAFGGLSFREIGAVLGRTETWARVTFYRAKEKLKGVWNHGT